MVICPRCAQQVDERTYATCPHCSTPLPAAGTQAGASAPGQVPSGQPYPGAPGQPPAPQSYAPQPSRGAGTRVSLTGEVIDDSPTSASASYGGGGAPTSIARPTSPTSRAANSPSRPETRSKSSGGSMVPGILFSLVLLAGLGTAGWWFLMPHSNPKTVVQQFDKAVADQDWKTVYSLMDLPDDAKKKYPDAAAFSTEMTNNMEKLKSNPMTAPFADSIFKAYQSAQVGEPSINGDNATVPVKMTMSITFMGRSQDKSMDTQVPLHKVGGTWKVDGLKGAIPSAMPGI